jgi:translation elongation factor EF-G
MAYLEGVEPSIDKLQECIRKGTLEFKFTPIVTGTAFKNKGVQTLLDAIIDYMPSPLDRPSITGVDANNVDLAIVRPSSDDAPFAALGYFIVRLFLLYLAFYYLCGFFSYLLMPYGLVYVSHVEDSFFNTPRS